MRGDDDVRHGNQPHQRVVCDDLLRAVLVEEVALFLVHIQTRRADLVAFQPLDQCLGIHQTAAGRVHEHDTGLHLRDGVCVDHVPRLVGERAVERNDVRLPQKLRQLHIVKTAFRIREFIVCQHAHPEALADTGKNSSDLACADYADGLAVQVEACESGQAEIEVARSDIRLVRVPVDGQQQRHRVLRHRVGGVRRDAEDMQLAEAGFGIHIVEARAAQRNDPNAQIIKFVYNLLIHRVVDEHAYAVKALCQLDGVLAESRLKILDLNVRSGNMLVKAGLVVGFRIKKCKLHDCIAPP